MCLPPQAMYRASFEYLVGGEIGTANGGTPVDAPIETIMPHDEG